MKSKFLVAVLALAISASTFAQLGRANMVESSVMLLGSAKVRAEIGMKGKEDEAMAKAMRTYADKAQGLMRQYSQNRNRLDELNKKLHAEQKVLISTALRLMTPSMEARLKQLGIQRFGPFSINAPDMRKDLKLTSAQIKTISATVDGYNKRLDQIEDRRKAYINSVRASKPKNEKDAAAMAAYRERLKKAIEKDRDRDIETLRIAKKAAEERVLATLSSAQRQQYERMKGKVYDFSRG